MHLEEKVWHGIGVGLFLFVFLFLMLLYIQLRINTETINTVATRQTLQLDNIKSKVDQGYNIDSDLMQNKAHNQEQKLLNTNRPGGGTDRSGIVASPKLGMPTKNHKLEYGQPYGFSNEQEVEWLTMFGKKRMTIYSARSGVNRGNFNTGYNYKGEDRRLDRNESYK